MAEPSHHFIELALRSLPAEGAVREGAADELAARLAHGGEDARALEDSIAQLEKNTPPAPWRLPSIAGLLMLTAGIIFGFLIPDHYQEFRLLLPLHGQGGNDDYYGRVLAATGPAASSIPLRAVYYSDKDAWRKQVQALLAEDPDNKAYYRYYAEWFTYWDAARSLPPDYHERWKTLDPDNAVWGINASNHLAERAILSKSRSAPAVRDEKSFQESLAYLKEAASCTHSYSHFAVIKRRQLGDFVAEDTLKSRYTERGVLNLAEGDHSAWLYSLSKVIPIQADRLASAGGKEGLKALVADFRKIMLLAAKDPTVSLDVQFSSMGSPLTALNAHCSLAGLSEEEAWLDEVAKAVALVRAGYRPPAANLARGASSWHRDRLRGSILITDADLKPGRQAEYAVADRFAAVGGSLMIFLVVGGLVIEVLRRGGGPRGLARGLQPLLRAHDWIWIFGAGVLAPLSWWLLIIHLSPLGCRDIGLTHYDTSHYVPLMQPWLSQAAGAVVLLLVSVLQVTRWRWAKRGAFLALDAKRLWIGWTMLGIAALFIPVQGIVRYLPSHQENFLIYGSSAGGIPLLWLLWQTVMGIACPTANALRGILTLRAMIPALLAVMLLLLATVPVLRHQERQWVAADLLSKPDPQGTGLSTLDRRMNDEFRDMLVESLE